MCGNYGPLGLLVYCRMAYSTCLWVMPTTSIPSGCLLSAEAEQEYVRRGCSRRDRRFSRVFGMSHVTGVPRMPLILTFSERGDLNRSEKGSALPAALVLKLDPRAVCILLIAIHHQQRPLPIGTFHSVRRYQRVSRAIVGVTPGGKYIVLFLARRDPLRMQRVAFSRETLSKMGITLPITVVIAIRDARKTSVGRTIVSRKTTMGQRISIGVTDGFGGSCRAGKVFIIRRELVLPIEYSPISNRFGSFQLTAAFEVVIVEQRGNPKDGRGSLPKWFSHLRLTESHEIAGNGHTEREQYFGRF